MKTLIKKEIRLLLPAWIAAMLVAVISPWIVPAFFGEQHPFFFHFMFPLGVLFLGITSFGMEFSSGTFSISLSQPMDRRLIWQVKTTILLIAFLAVWMAAVMSFLCRYNIASADIGSFQRFDWQNYRLYSLEILTLSALVAFSGGLWTTLLLRQMTGAFWVTLLTPLVVQGGIETLLGMWIVSGWIINVVVIAVLTAYTIAGFFLARWLFFHAQDTQWAGGNISFAWHSGAASRTVRPARRPGNWASALVLKEIHVHQVNICIAGVLLVLQLFCLAALRIYPYFNYDTIFALKSVWVIWCLMPLLIGSSVIAEERRLGVMETQLCLPVSRMAQWFAKLSVALALSLLFGGLVPFAIVNSGGADSSLDAPAALFFIYPFAMALVSIYASSLVRSTLLAIGTAMAISAILWAACAAIVTWNLGGLFLNFYDRNQETGFLVIILFLGAPFLLVVLAGLTYWNFKWLHEGSRLWRYNAISVAATVLSLGILTNAIYFRAWESTTPSVPAPGPARLEHATLKFGSGSTVFAVLPDGRIRIWSDMLAYQEVTNLWWETTVLVPQHSHSRFLDGSNWVDVAADNFQLLGIQSDGTLWSVQRKWDSSQKRWRQSGSFTQAQIGSDTNWAQVASGQIGFMLLKRDGSLWRWGYGGFFDLKHGVSIPKKLALDRSTIPSRADVGTDWLDLFSSRGTPYAEKRDGSLWQWGQLDQSSESGIVPALEADTNGPWSSVAFCENDAFAGVNTNGELRLFISTPVPAAAKAKRRVVKIRLDENAKWRICGNESWDGIWAIRDDGTLWKWPPKWSILDNPRTRPIQMGTRSDWLALSSAWQFGISLAADGSVWAWNQPSRHIWLAPPRKPIYLGNIFEQSDGAGQLAAAGSTHENAN
ncbi:MAG TPA: ABC transporter permease [Verrucomicrobiae bacterium]|jgi:hypothetical protein|nr:ABC transporter permease [Verrucomicrobiae bacterium]